MSTQAIEAGVVRNAARGSWLSVLDHLAPEIEKAILKPGRHIACPIHGGKDGFKLFKDADISGGGICYSCGAKPDGFSLLMWLSGWSFPDTLSAVAGVLGINSEPYQKPIRTLRPVIAESKDTRNSDWIKTVGLRKVWRQSVSIHHPSAEPVRLYLRSRGLDGWFPDWPSLRFHPKMKYCDEDGNLVGYFPAMLALMESGDQAVTIHRTFLTLDGRKATVNSPKKQMPIPTDRLAAGAAIRLGSPGRVLSTTEGIETALAVIEATGMITWPLVSATLMGSFIIPPGVEKLIIWADLDRSEVGVIASLKLAGRAKEQGVEVIIRVPEGPIPANAKSVDWLDVLNRQGPNAFAWRSP